MERIFGIDIGTTSIGFAVIDWDEAAGEGRVARMGVRIFPEGVTEDKKEPRNQARRAARLLRRQIRRRRRRRKDFGDLLAAAGLLPRFGTPEWHAAMAVDPYELRAHGTKGPLGPFEAGRALYHLVKHAGFLSARQIDAEEREDKETGKVKDAIGGLRRELNGRTLGEFLQECPAGERKRGRYLGRDMVIDEFNRLWQAQAPHHPAMTEELRSQVFATAFFRRPTYWRLDTLGTCRFVPDSPLCATGSWIGQRSIMLEKVNSLRLAGGNERELMADEREKALALLGSQRTATFGALRKAIGLPRGQLFNFEVAGLEGLPGNATEAALIKAFGRDWQGMAEALKDRVRREIFDCVQDVYYRRVGKHRIELRKPEEVAERRTVLGAALQADYGITHEQAVALGDISLPSGWRRISVIAVEKMLPYLEEGEIYNRAVEHAFGVSHSQEAPTGELLRRLPSGSDDMPDVRNPTVNRALNEMRKVVNNLLAADGRPSIIRIELARDLRIPKRERKAMDERNRDRERARKKAVGWLVENGIRDPSRDDIDKYLLWQETKETCPYTGRKISFDSLFRTGEFDFEHIVPRSWPPFNNSFANKTLCEKQANIAKGDRTPYKFFQGRPDDWALVKSRAANLLAENPAKLRRFLREDPAEAEAEEFAERQLRDTAYVAREARDFLARLGPDIRVQTCNGRVTAQLRDLWGLNTILGDSGAKNRADHRHHAIDAVAVALATPGIVKRLSDHYKAERRVRHDQMPSPWSALRHDVEKAVERIVVSHRVRRKVSGALHAQTSYGDTSEERADGRTTYRLFVTRKPLEGISRDRIGTIRDPVVRDIVLKHLEARGGDPKKAFPPFPKLPNSNGEEQEIRKVRVLVKQQLALMVPLNSRTRAYADPGDNHHMEVFRSPDGKIRHDIVSLFEATRRLRAGEPVVRRVSGVGERLKMSLGPGDTLEFPGKDSGPFDYRVVTGVWANGPIVLEDHRAADGTVWKRPSAASILAAGARKVAVDPIGRVRPAND